MKNFKLLIATTAFLGMLLPTYGSDHSPVDGSSSAPTPTTRTQAVSSPSSSTGDRPLTMLEMQQILNKQSQQIAKMQGIIMNLQQSLIDMSYAKTNPLFGSKFAPEGWIAPWMVTFGDLEKQFTIRKADIEKIAEDIDKTMKRETAEKRITSERQKTLLDDIGSIERQISDFDVSYITLAKPLFEQPNIQNCRSILLKMDKYIAKKKISRELSSFTSSGSSPHLLQECLRTLRERKEFEKANQLELHWIQPGYWTSEGVHPDHIEEFKVSIRQALYGIK